MHQVVGSFLLVLPSVVLFEQGAASYPPNAVFRLGLGRLNLGGASLFGISAATSLTWSALSLNRGDKLRRLPKMESGNAVAG